MDEIANSPTAERPPTSPAPSIPAAAVVAGPIGATGAASAEIHDASRTNRSFADALRNALEQLVVLRVTTVVGTVTAESADQLHQVTTLKLAPADQKVASLSINMALGDCSIIVSPVFAEDAAYKQLHGDAVEKAIAVREQTVKLLEEAFEKFKDFLHL